MSVSWSIKLIVWILPFLICSGFKSYAAHQILLATSGSNKVSVIENSINRLVVFNTLSSFDTLLLKTDKGEFVELLAGSYSKSNKIGAPQLPVLSRMIEIPAGSSAIVTVISYDVKEFRLSDYGITRPLFPAQPPQSKGSNRNAAVEWNKQLYATNSFYSEALAKVEVAGYMRSVQLASLILSPVAYNPVTNTIRVYDNLLVEVRFAAALKARSAETNAGNQSPYFNGFLKNVLNYQPVETIASATPAVPAKYVIVSDPMFREALQPFIKWKIKRGFQITEAYTDDPAVGKTNQSIKAYLQNLYASATPTDPAPTFVLFVGDVDQIPAFNCGDHVSDLYYCEYTGDYLPDAFYGRFSANSVAELQPQIDKTLQYEQFKMPDPSFLDEVVLAAGADISHQQRWGNGQVNYATTNYFNAGHNLIARTYLQPEPAGGNYSQKIQADISNGVSYANYSAHGSPEGWSNPMFSISDIAKLNNINKYGLIVANCCLTSSFNLNSFGEELVRAANKGALAYIGSSGLTYWDEDYYWSVGYGSVVANPAYETTGLGALDRMFHGHNEPRSAWCSTAGQMVFAGNLAVQESNSTLKKYYWEIYCLMGDPSTMVYFSSPPAITAHYNSLLPMGASKFEVRTEPFASVAISKNNKLNGVAEADENGLAVVSLLPIPEAGYANIVVTKQNRRPFIDSVRVAIPDEPYLLADYFAIKDAEGNNTSIAEAAGLLTMDIVLKNVGAGNAVNAVSTLITHDPYIAIQSDTFSWPLIRSNATQSAANAFSFRVKDGVPDMYKASFAIRTKTDTSTFVTEFSCLVYAPQLKNGNISFEDSTAGNGNGQIDAGETIFVSVAATNSGHRALPEGRSRLVSTDPKITVHSSSVTLGTLNPGASGTSMFGFTVSRDAVPGSSFRLFAITEAGAYNSVSALYPAIGSKVEDFETADFSKFNWQMKGNKSWEISPSVNYEGMSGAKSGAINNSERSEMYLEGLVLFTDTISFYHKVSSERGYDFLRFYMDDVELGSWSGNDNWSRAVFPVSAGTHRFRWAYEKDVANAAGSDAAWIDFIRWPSMSSAGINDSSISVLAEPASICAGNQSQLYVFAPGLSQYDYHWLPSVSLSDTTIFNPLANPHETTTYTFRVSGRSFSSSGKVTVNVQQSAVTPVVSVLDKHLVSSATAGNQWYSSDGLISGATSATYYPNTSGAYYVISGKAQSCPSDASNTVEFVYTGIKASPEIDFSVYPNPFTGIIHVNYSRTKAGPVKIILYNAVGNQVGVIADGSESVGSYAASFDGTHLPAGIYTCKIMDETGYAFSKVIKIK